MKLAQAETLGLLASLILVAPSSRQQLSISYSSRFISCT